MDKRRLRTMAEMPASPWMALEAGKARLKKNSTELWYAEVSGDPKDGLVLRIYERSKIIGGIAGREAYRLLLGIKNREYIAYQPGEKPPKCWKEGRLDSVLRWSDGYEWIHFADDWKWVSKGYTQCITFTADGERLLEAALGPLEADETWGCRIYRWQDKIVSERRTARHEKELEPVVELMSHIPELPGGFFDWLRTDGIARFDYAIYDPPKGKKKTRIQCTRCGADVQADVKKFHPVVNKRGTCPACGRPVTWKTVTSKLDRSEGYWRYDEPWYLSIIQRMEKGLVIRYFFVDVHFFLDYGNFKERQVEWGEVARDVFSDTSGNTLECKRYERIRYKNHGELRWAPSVDAYKCDEAFLYTGNLPDVLKGTAWQYSGIREYQQKMWPKNIPVVHYLQTYPHEPYIEYFSKMGLTRLVRDAIRPWNFEKMLVNRKARRPDELFGIPMQDVKQLIRLNGGITMLILLQRANLADVRLSDEELLHYIDIFGSEGRHLYPVVSGDMCVDIHKRLKYFKKQAGKAYDRKKRDRRQTKAEALVSIEKNLWNDWKDYMGWLGRFTPECAGDEYYVLPPDLPKAHDRLMKIENDRQKKADEKRRRRTERDVNRILAEMQETGGMGMQARGLLIRLPKDAAEIRTEGQVMHHCVATYIDRVQKSQTLILFVRKVEDPDTPFYTLEWKDGKVAQCRGMRNADMTPEVRAFVNAFERRMQKRGDKPKTPQRVRVTA